MSVPIVLIWAFFNLNCLFKGKEGRFFLILTVLMLFSSMISVVYSGSVKFETDLPTSFKRTFQYITVFCYYFLFREHFKDKTVKLNRIILLFYLCLLVFAVLYFLFPDTYASLKILINPSDNHTRRYLEGIVVYRFNYLWTDPNNVAYLAVGLMGFYLIRVRSSFLEKVFVILSSIFVVGMTASMGGIIVLMPTLLLSFPQDDYRNKRLIGAAFKRFLLLIVLALVAYLIIRHTFLSAWYDETLAKISARFAGYGRDLSSAGGRLDDFTNALAMINPSFVVIGSGKEGFSSEIGHLYVICMYGLVAYFIFMYLSFKRNYKQKLFDYVWVFPFFIAFTVNIAIGEFKWFAIFLLLVASVRFGVFEKEV